MTTMGFIKIVVRAVCRAHDLFVSDGCIHQGTFHDIICRTLPDRQGSADRLVVIMDDRVYAEISCTPEE